YCHRVGIMRAGKRLALDTPHVLKQSALKGVVWDIHAEPLLPVLAALQESDLVLQARLAGDHLSAITPKEVGETALQDLIKSVGGAKVQIEAVEASLEDVFLSLALEHS
ncbi:MAG: ABC transporter ATP-binding protein, partial [Anaerolineae bacterium]|nr:ABC transporter ATP-binding protein [Anaerolineae bacterium]